MPHGKFSDFVSFPFLRSFLVIKLRNFSFESHWNSLNCFNHKKILCQILGCPMEISLIFIWFPLFGFTLFKKKIEKFRFWKSLRYLKFFLIDKDIKSDFTMANKRMSDSVSVLLFGLTFVIKLKNFCFENHWNTLIFFYKQRYGVKFEYVS